MRPSKERRIKIPFVDKPVYVHVLRQGFEHFAVIGAGLEFVTALCHWELFVIAVVGKAAFLTGGLAVYLFHVEESMHQRHLERVTNEQG